LDLVTTEPAAQDARFALHGGRAVELYASGFSHPSGGVQRFTPYRELIHVTASARGLRIAAEHGCEWLARTAFVEPDAAQRLAEALRERVLALPEGAALSARQQALDRRQAAPSQPRVGLALALVCIGLQAAATLYPAILLEGEYYRGALGLAREPWRLVTAQLLHANVVHLALNALGLFVLGGLLERQIGGVRTALVFGAAAVGAMLGCVVARYELVLGASGLVSGAVGGLLALELRRPDLLPGLLRLSRRVLIGALIAEFVLLSFIPNVAHAAHIGGLLAGALCALGTAPRDALSFETGRMARAACGALLVLSLAALAAFGHGLLDPGLAAARRGLRLLESPAAPILLLNNDAWTIATTGRPTREQLELALALSSRAVEATQRLDPNLLDTLAEVYFQLGRGEEAVEVIDEAIALVPGAAYFEEQRLRFLGERAADDRPEPPAEMPPPDRDSDPDPEEYEFDSDGPGLRV
jgi:membrane associated rhomboid family serine protease